jgi:hypothetical protein
MTRRLAVTLAVAATAALVVVLSLLMTGGDDSARPAASTAAGSSTAATVPVTAPAPAPEALPDAVPGFVVSPVGLRTYRLSLVFRLRNTILNGLPGGTSDYVFQAAQARRGADRALLFGIGAVPGAAPPDIPRSIRTLVGMSALSRHRTAGLAIDVYRLPDYVLAVVAATPRRALVVIASARRLAEDLADAAARAAARE